MALKSDERGVDDPAQRHSSDEDDECSLVRERGRRSAWLVRMCGARAVLRYGYVYGSCHANLPNGQTHWHENGHGHAASRCGGVCNRAVDEKAELQERNRSLGGGGRRGGVLCTQTETRAAARHESWGIGYPSKGAQVRQRRVGN